MEFAVYNVAIAPETNAPNNTSLGIVSIPRTEIPGWDIYKYPRYIVRHIEGTTFMTEEYFMRDGNVVRLVHAVNLGDPVPPPSIPSQASPAVPSAGLRLVEPALVSTGHAGPNTITLTYDVELDPYIEYAGFYRLSGGWEVTDVGVEGRTITLTYGGAGSGTPSITRFADVRHPVYEDAVPPQQPGAGVLPPPPPPPPPQRGAPGQ